MSALAPPCLAALHLFDVFSSCHTLAPFLAPNTVLDNTWA
jgi:hypothetical protein